MLIHIEDCMLTSAKNGLLLTKEQEELCKVIYRKTNDGYLICGLYNPDIPDKDYPDGLAAFPFRSSFGGYVQLAGGSSVFNVNNSSGDKYKGKPNDSWMDIWESSIKNYDAELDRTNPLPGNRKHNNHTRKSYVDPLPDRIEPALVGGHICTSRDTQNRNKGGECLLLPIYRYLNSMRETVQMTVIPGGAVALRLIKFLE